MRPGPQPQLWLLAAASALGWLCAGRAVGPAPEPGPGTPWDGCTEQLGLPDATRPLPGVPGLCWRLTEPLTGDQAWETCSSWVSQDDRGWPSLLSALLRALRAAGVAEVWAGGRELYPGALLHQLSRPGASYNSTVSAPAGPGGGGGCLAIRAADRSFVSRNCSGLRRPAVCLRAAGRLAVRRDGTACPAAAGGRLPRVSLYPLPGCFLPHVAHCTGPSSAFVSLRYAYARINCLPGPEGSASSRATLLSYIGPGRPPVFLQEASPDKMENATCSFCGDGDVTPGTLQLYLRFNRADSAAAALRRTAEGAVLYVRHPWRVSNLPTCVGAVLLPRRPVWTFDARGRSDSAWCHSEKESPSRLASFNRTDGDTSLYLLRTASPTEPAVVWCYLKDAFTGSIATSNRILLTHSPWARHDFGLATALSAAETAAAVPGAVPGAGMWPLRGGLTVTSVQKPSPGRSLTYLPRNCEPFRFRPRGSTTEQEVATSESRVCLRCLGSLLQPPPGLDPDHWLPAGRSAVVRESLCVSQADSDECKDDTACLDALVWNVMRNEANDVNKDGEVNCDDFLYFTWRRMAICGHLNASFPDIFYEYLRCMTDPRGELVQLFEGGETVRFRCVDEQQLGMRWEGPEYAPGDEHTTAEPEHTTAKPERTPTEPEHAEDSRRLSELAAANRTLSAEEAAAAVRAASRLLGSRPVPGAKGTTHTTQIPMHSAAAVPPAEFAPPPPPEPVYRQLERAMARVGPGPLSVLEERVAVQLGPARGFVLLGNASEASGPGASPLAGPGALQRGITSREEIFMGMSEAQEVKAAALLPEAALVREGSAAFITYAHATDFVASAEEDQEQGPDGAGGDLHPTEACLNSLVVSVEVRGADGRPLPLPLGSHVEVMVRGGVQPGPGQRKMCAYWLPERRRWSTAGCSLHEGGGGEGLDACRCSHLTHFAQVLTGAGGAGGGAGLHGRRLRLLSAAGCGLSLAALAGVAAAAACSRRWRAKIENKVLLNLAAAVALNMGLFLWSARREPPEATAAVAPVLGPAAGGEGWCASPPPPPAEPAPLELEPACRAVGALLHYSVLASASWMLAAAVAHYLRLATFTGPAGVRFFLLKAAALAWGAPLLPVLALLLVAPDSYAGPGRDFCYPSGPAFYGAVLAPVAAVLAGNALLFGLVVWRLGLLAPGCGPGGSPHAGRASAQEGRILGRKLLVCVAFVFLFGLTWFLGMLSYYSVVFAYLFCLTATLQGVVVFVFFVLGAQHVRAHLAGWWRGFRRMSPRPSAASSDSAAPTSASGNAASSDSTRSKATQQSMF